MEISTENCTSPLLDSRLLHMEAIQTIVPQKPTDESHSYRVQLSKSPFSGNFQTSFQLVICQKALMSESYYSGWVLAGWFKESLGRSLVQEPIFAGRLRKLENRDDDGGVVNLEIVANDSGVRMVEASIEMNLDEFLDLKGQTQAETDLVFWENINENTPQYSPLFFVQVTNFKCGGFSIGISCSLLVGDPLYILSFIDKWSDIHKIIVSTNIRSKIPLFYLPNLGKTASSPPLKTHPCKGAKRSQSVTFTIETEKSDLEDGEIIFKNLAAWCLDEVDKKLGKKKGTSNVIICFFLKEASGNVKIESCTREEVDSKKKPTPLRKFTCRGRWDCMRVREHLFGGSNISHASSWINSDSADEEFVMVIPSLSEGGLKTIIMVMVKVTTDSS